MGFALVLRELSKHRLLLALGVLVAALAAISSVYRLEGQKLKPKSLQYSSASAKLLVDSSSSVLANLSESFEPLSGRAAVYANFMASPAVLQLVGQQVGLSGEQIYAAGPVNANEPRVEQEPTALKRNVQITGETVPYRLNFENQSGLPTISVFSQAPTTALAVALADASVVGLQRYLTALENANHVPPGARVTIRQLGPANGAAFDSGISKRLAVMVFVGVFVLWSVLVLAWTRFRKVWRESATLLDEPDDPSETTDRGEGPGETTEEAPQRDDSHDDESTLYFPASAPSEREDDRPAVSARSML